MAIHDSILDTIGNTPIIRTDALAPEGIELYLKLEAANPGGSVKDRLALAIIEAAERDGSLRPGQTVVEATSGNTGIGLAMVCAKKGYPLVIVMAESFSVERRRLMRFLGAKVVLTPASEKGTGMIRKARELAETHGWFLARQFENPANAEVHARTTGREIVDDFGRDGLDCFVTGFGTGGTLSGVSRTLRAESPATRIVAAEPDNSAIMASGYIQASADDGSPLESHPGFRPHPVQGWSADFIPLVAQEALDARRIDRFVGISGDRAMAAARELARKEGIFVGISAGATVAAALEAAKDLPKGSKVLAMLPDTGERYLSTPLFADIPAEMTEEEQEISRSTDTARFDAAPKAVPAAVAPPAADQAALDEVIATAEAHPVVMYALQWCEFCWSVRRMFQEAGIDYHVVELDGPDFRQGDRATRIRAALREITGAPTIPQVFVAGEHLGGATETFDAYNSGRLQALLESRSLPMQAAVANAYSYLPSWLHPR